MHRTRSLTPQRMSMTRGRKKVELSTWYVRLHKKCASAHDVCGSHEVSSFYGFLSQTLRDQKMAPRTRSRGVQEGVHKRGFRSH